MIERNADGIVKGYPFNRDDVWSLAKGDYIDPRACEQAAGVTRTDPKAFRVKLLALREKLERAWFEVRGERITTATEKDGIRIFDDAGAVKQNGRSIRIVGRRTRRTVRSVGGIDASKIDDASVREELVRLGIRAAALLCGGTREVRAALKAYKRNTPAKLPAGKE